VGILVTLAAGTAAASARKPELRIDVTEPSGIARRGWPISVGVPFPRGAHKDVSNLRLQAAGSTAPATPVQTRVLTRWPDGTVRWALLDWQADLSPRQHRRYRLTAGSPARARSALKVTEDAAAIAIDTGPLRFTIPKDRFAVLDTVQLDRNPAGTGAVTAFIDVDGTRHDAQVPTSVKVLERGPVRVRVELRGDYGADLHYVIRVDAFAGQPFVRLLHSFDHRGSQLHTKVRQIAMEVPLLSAGPAAFRAGREGRAPLAGALGDTPVTLFQEDKDTLRLNGSPQEGRTQGWVDVHEAGHGIAVAGRFVWQEYPQSFQLSSKQLIYNLWAPEAPPADIGMGVAKTHELVLQFSGRSQPRPEQLASIAEPVVGYVNPEWVVASATLPDSIARTPTTTAFIDQLQAGFRRFQERSDREEWDDAGTIRCPEQENERRRSGFYGMVNWGDWNFPWYHDTVNGCDTWGNLEYDGTYALALTYALTGDRAVYDALTAAARHFMDVDRIHSAAPPCNCEGMNHPRTALHFSFELGDVDLGYTWTQGLVSYFYLTGDERALDAARGIADYLVRRLAADGAKLMPRQWGWPQIALLATYEATGNIEYANAAQEYARRSMAAYPPTSGGDLGVGTLADALSYVHAQTQDPAIRDWLVAYAAAVMASPPAADPRYFPAVAYVGHITSNTDYKSAAAAAVPRQEFGDWGKSFTLAARLGFRILSLTR
jgi:hypothetical protein